MSMHEKLVVLRLARKLPEVKKFCISVNNTRIIFYENLIHPVANVIIKSANHKHAYIRYGLRVKFAQKKKNFQFIFWFYFCRYASICIFLNLTVDLNLSKTDNRMKHYYIYFLVTK